MMKLAKLEEPALPSEWTPQEHREREAKIAAIKSYAAAVRNWELLDEAVDQQINDQHNLVEWWRENIRNEGRPKTRQDPAVFSEDELKGQCGIAPRTVSRWRQALAGDLDEYRELLRGPSWRKAMGERGSSDQRGASGTGENEWFTPPEYIEAARQVMGEIDLDPATAPAAQKIIQAKAFYTKVENGLFREWRGRVWLNPPYAQPLIAEFISKRCQERSAGRVTEAITLTHNYTDTAWFHELAGIADAICFTRGRVRFYDGDKIAQPTQGQAFAYLGENVARFTEIFRSIGFIAYMAHP